MLAIRDQENLAASHQHGAAIKQQQQAQASRRLGPKTPGAKFSKTPMKVPLNDENGAQSKAIMGGDKSSFVTPMTHRARAVLGNKTTNAKAKGLQTVNGKSAVNGPEQSHAKPQNTVRPRQRDPQSETSKLQIHAEKDLASEDEPEYCPPAVIQRPYQSDVFPRDVLTFDALKPENMMKGYYRYYFNSKDETGTSRQDRHLQAKSRKAIEECERQIKEDLDELEWSVKGELEPEVKAVKRTLTSSTKLPVPRRPHSTLGYRNAANVVSIDDTRKVVMPSAIGKVGRPMHKRSSSFSTPASGAGAIRPATSLLPSHPKKPIEYSKDRATPSLFARPVPSGSAGNNTSRSASALAHRRAIPRPNTTLSNHSDRTTTSGLNAHKQTATVDSVDGIEDDADTDIDDLAWKEHAPFLSIFNPDYYGGLGDEEGEDDDPLCIRSNVVASLDHEDDDDAAFELKLVD